MHVTAGYAPIMPTYQGQISEDGLIDLVEYIKQLNSQYRIQQTIDNSGASPSDWRYAAGDIRSGASTRDGEAMSTIVYTAGPVDSHAAEGFYLNKEYGLKSWLLTGDHKRIAMLYLISITFFFFIGGAIAGAHPPGTADAASRSGRRRYL